MPEIADAVVEITETGRALKAAGLRVLETILVSYTELIANPTSYEDPERRKAMEDINTLLQGALKARGRVLVKLNVEAADLGPRDLTVACDAQPDGLGVIRRRQLRGRDRGAERGHKQADPRAERRRRF